MLSTQPDDITAPAGARAGEYEIREVLGRGGMGTVYAGLHPVIGKEVAIKVLDPRLATSTAIVERFQREARAVNKIQHPNIIDIFAFGHSPDLGHYFVMPRLRGENLGDRIARAPMTPEEALPVITEIVDALAAAHAAGIAHRDLKPDNIFLETARKGGVTVQLLDFGIAKLLDADPSHVTRSGTQMGTPLFMAPEQWDGAGIDHRADTYALGIIVHHMLTGRYPFESESPLALMNMHGNAAPTLPSAYGGPASVDPVIARALQKDKLLRFQSATELLDALRAALVAPAAAGSMSPAGSGLGSTSGSTLDAIEAARPKRRGVIVAIAAGACAVIVIAVVVLRRDSRDASNAQHSDASVVADPADPSATAADASAAVEASAAADASTTATDASKAAPVDASRPPVVDARGQDIVDARGHQIDARGWDIVDAGVARSIDAREPARVDAAVRATPEPRDASVPRAPRDSSWGSTVDPFSEDSP